MNLSLVSFLIGILGFVLNRKNIILMLISIEIMLLSITFLILVSSLGFDDILGQTYAIYVIAIAGAESAIGLAILVAFYRLRGSISIEYTIMYLAIIVLPLLGSIVSGLFGRKVINIHGRRTFYNEKKMSSKAEGYNGKDNVHNIIIMQSSFIDYKIFTKSFWYTYLVKVKSKFTFNNIISTLLTIMFVYFFKQWLVHSSGWDISKFTEYFSIGLSICIFSKIVKPLLEQIFDVNLSDGLGMSKMPMGPSENCETGNKTDVKSWNKPDGKGNFSAMNQHNEGGSSKNQTNIGSSGTNSLGSSRSNNTSSIDENRQRQLRPAQPKAESTEKPVSFLGKLTQEEISWIKSEIKGDNPEKAGEEQPKALPFIDPSKQTEYDVKMRSAIKQSAKGGSGSDTSNNELTGQDLIKGEQMAHTGGYGITALENLASKVSGDIKSLEDKRNLFSRATGNKPVIPPKDAEDWTRTANKAQENFRALVRMSDRRMEKGLDSPSGELNRDITDKTYERKHPATNITDFRKVSQSQRTHFVAVMNQKMESMSKYNERIKFIRSHNDP